MVSTVETAQCLALDTRRVLRGWAQDQWRDRGSKTQGGTQVCVRGAHIAKLPYGNKNRLGVKWHRFVRRLLSTGL